LRALRRGQARTSLLELAQLFLGRCFDLCSKVTGAVVGREPFVVVAEQFARVSARRPLRPSVDQKLERGQQ
jgi:hypothetical protein